jgi:hypothetical protein
MIQRALASKGLVAYVLACATGITLYFRWPFPENDLMLRLISIRAPLIYAGFKYTYTLFLFTTPHIGYRFMRHPGYFAMLISVPASALAIRSWVALVPAACFVLVILRRAQLEDEFLKRNLPGYTDYVLRVPAKLLPPKRVFRSFYAQHKP